MTQRRTGGGNRPAHEDQRGPSAWLVQSSHFGMQSEYCTLILQNRPSEPGAAATLVLAVLGYRRSFQPCREQRDSHRCTSGARRRRSLSIYDHTSVCGEARQCMRYQLVVCLIGITGKSANCLCKLRCTMALGAGDHRSLLSHSFVYSLWTDPNIALSCLTG